MEVSVFSKVIRTRYRKGDKNKEMKELLVKAKELNGRYYKESAEPIYQIILECGKKINGLRSNKVLKDKAKNTLVKKYKTNAINELKKLEPNDATILGVIKQCFEKKGDFDFKKYGMLTLNLLFSSKKKQVLKCFKQSINNEEKVLIKMKEVCEYNLFGEKYQTCTKDELK